MSRPVDADLVARFVLRETTDAEAAEVTRLVAEDPAWKAELQAQALLDVHMHEAFDALRADSRAERPAAAPARQSSLASWFSGWRLALPTLALAMAAVLWLRPGPTVGYEVELHGGESVVRAAGRPEDGPRRFTHGSSLDLVLRAQATTDAFPDVTVSLDGAPLAGVQIERVPGGSIHLTGVFGEGLAEPSRGAHKLTVRVGDQTHDLDITWASAAP